MQKTKYSLTNLSTLLNNTDTQVFVLGLTLLSRAKEIVHHTTLPNRIKAKRMAFSNDTYLFQLDCRR